MSLDVDKISQLSKRDLGVLIAELRTLTHDLLTEQIESFAKDLEKLSKAETKFEVESIKEVTIRTAVSTPPAGSAFTFANGLPIRATGTLPKKFFGEMTQNEQDKLESVIRKGWVDGATIREMVQRVRGTRISNFQDGFTKQAKARIEAQVRTATQHYSSASRKKVWVDNSDIIEGYQWVSTLDSRTTQQCRSLDKREFAVGDGPLPPIHYSCRSTTVAVLDDGLDFLDDGATRSARGPSGKSSSVDADETYYSWLKKQPSRFQDVAIGPTRGKLLRDGGLSADQFGKLNLNRNFEPMSLKEMEAKNPIAFEKAGINV
jgi:SPP1 gp7 family putative phage head morphogenesis protein